MTADWARAEALFKQERHMHEGEKAMAEYRAAEQAMRDKTARLRTLRLARNALGRNTPLQTPAG